jgi:hypothetical protein
MAIAFNANIGLGVGTTPGIDHDLLKYPLEIKFAENIDVNYSLVKNLKNMRI